MILLSLLHETPVAVISVVLFLALMACYVGGQRIRKKFPSLQQSKEGQTVSNTLLGLLALLLAFSFGMSNTRFDTRRKLLSDETNAISTAILRTDLYPDSVRLALHAAFRRYIQSRLDYYQYGVNGPKMLDYYATAETDGKQIWDIAAATAKNNLELEESVNLIPALNSMLDLAASRLAAHLGRVPDSILYFLFMLCLSSTFLLGYENKNQIEWIPITGFSLMLSLTIFSILDLDSLHSGFISLDSGNQRLGDLLQLLKDKHP